MNTPPFPIAPDAQSLERGAVLAPRFDEHGLIAAIATDAGSGEVLMLAWMDAEALLRFEKYFAELEESQQHAICDDICYEPNAKTKFARAATFFARYRDLTVGAFYSTPAGWKPSFVNNLMPSAIGCRRPNGPTRFGPSLSCMRAMRTRSVKVI